MAVELPVVRSLGDLARLVAGRTDLFLRWPAEEGDGAEVPLVVEAWWGDRSRATWVAHRLLEGAAGPGHAPPVVVEGADRRPVACVDPAAIDEAVASLHRPDVVDEHLPADASSAARARQLVRALLERHHVDGDRANGVLVAVSELVTNAVLHAGTELDVIAELAGDRLTVRVADASTTLPVRRMPDLATPGGRGLGLVEQLSDRWGVDTSPGGKAVWFEVGVNPEGAATDDP